VLGFGEHQAACPRAMPDIKMRSKVTLSFVCGGGLGTTAANAASCPSPCVGAAGRKERHSGYSQCYNWRISRLGTRWKSRTLRVASVVPVIRAVAAIKLSRALMP